MAKSPATSMGSPTKPSGASADVLLEIDFTKPLENFGRKIGDQANPTQRAPQARAHQTLIELLPELIQTRNSIPKWRAMIEEIHGIQRNPAEQMQRLDDLNFAIQRRSELLKRHRALLTQNDVLTGETTYGLPSETSSGLPTHQTIGQKR